MTRGNGLRAATALQIGRGIGRASKAWGQTGLGTLFKWVGRLPVLSDATCDVEFSPGNFFRTAVFEPYWGPTIVGGRPYEPELLAMLRELRDSRATFIDCGANFGYWSIVATGREIGFRRAVAIEANPPTYEHLVANAEANNRRFECVHRAVTDTDGGTVTLGHTEHHAIAHISRDGVGSGVTVQSTTLDAVLTSLSWVDDQPIVLKIDVEGHEPEAIAGAAALRARTDHVIIFEDFARADLPTARFMAKESYRLAYVMRDGSCRWLASVEDARRHIKADGKLTRPLNFLAVKRGGALEKRVDAWATRRT